MAGVCVIVANRPKSGKGDELLELVRSRSPTLRKEGLVSDRAPTIMRARDGTIIEVSEWKSREAIDAAHKNPNILAMWEKFFALCDCVPLNTLAEARECLPASSRSIPSDCSRTLILTFSPREKEPLSRAMGSTRLLSHSLPLGETHAPAAVRAVFQQSARQ
jgi:quinol monooxygenase YgiN